MQPRPKRSAPTDPSAAPAPERRAKSALAPWQRGLYGVVLLLSLIMLGNTAYLLLNRVVFGTHSTATADATLNIVYQVMLLGHSGAGLALAAVTLVFIFAHLVPVWRRKRAATLISGIAALFSIAGLAFTGVFIVTAAATRNNAWAWHAHVSLAALMPAAFLLHRLWSFRPATRTGVTKFSLAVTALTALIFAAHRYYSQPVSPASLPIAGTTDVMDGSLAEYLRRATQPSKDEFVGASDVSIKSRFFPAGTSTTTGDFLNPRVLINEYAGVEQLASEDFSRVGFAVQNRIGAEMCARCHMDVVDQWSQSAHRFASFNNPFYEATINLMRETADTPGAAILAHLQHFNIPIDQLPWVRSKWCSACHDPALMIPGLMTKPINRQTPPAQAGLTCLACHQIDAIHNNTGNGHYNIADEQRDPYIFAGVHAGWGAYLHDIAVKARPAAHMRQMLKPMHRTSEFCSACHKVNLDDPVNSYRWIRGQNEYDNWHDSGIAHNASRTFYKPPTARQCRDCHMPLEDAPRGDVAAKDGKVRSHRFLAVNTALPFVRGDDDMLRRTEAFLRDKQLRVDIFAVGPRDANAVFAPAYAPDLTKPALPAAELLRVDVVVRNLNVGHTFPGGTNDSNESWIHFQALDTEGNVIAESGAVAPDQHVDTDAHFYRVVMLDHDGNRVYRRDAHNFHVPVYSNVIGPGTADVAHYEFTLPESLRGKQVTLRARLMWRKFDRAYTEFAFHNNRAGFAAFDDVPNLPITEIAAAEVALGVAIDSAGFQVHRDPPLPRDAWQRINDYGIALLLEGDTRGAIAAFEALARHSPERPDAFRNLARVYRADGDLAAAYAALRDTERLAPGDLQNAWVWGQVLAEDGRFEEAIEAYGRIVSQWTDDRGAWREITVAAHKSLRFDEALAAADQVLRIDPEDRVANYYRMLSARALGREAEARLAQAAYEKYNIDESAQEITQSHRLKHAGDNLESQVIHTHVLTPRATPYATTPPREKTSGTR
ncbi:MAG: tetratricopeptide repeat protein [Phycisphaerales bacterium]|nr:tetratricopeptide repeat protein [Phycisphaerales bacterium]